MKNEESTSSKASVIDRRDLIKMGLIASVAMAGCGLMKSSTSTAPGGAETPVGPLPPWGSLPLPTGPTRRVSSAGFKVSGNRAFGMAQPDDITRQVLDYAASFWTSPMPDSVLTAVNDLMVDSLGCIIAGFDSDPVRASARVASQSAGTTLKSTVMGYGISTSVEMATHANCCMVRHND